MNVWFNKIFLLNYLIQSIYLCKNKKTILFFSHPTSFQQFYISQSTQYYIFGSFHNFSTNNHFIKNSKSFMKVEYNIQFTDIAKILIQYFNKQMYYFQVGQFIIVYVNAYRKEQPSISLINNFIVSKFQKVSVLSISTVSYTHLTLPTICSVQISVVAVSLKKKKQHKNLQEM
eukprot:TRINITY_DN17625_c0_g1_i1.p1 TRINITY_DN17625_c0_g1~~TRINITY_DN17625_c0_g1_i1.p1  ORF type:complete len:173 (-),score=29.63 TRINITY_DN17625_c0_g1_i1:27-545(-)